jgi:hypothetical protein
MHLKIGDRVRLTEDQMTDDLHKGLIYISGTKDSIAVIVSTQEVLLHDPDQEIDTHKEFLEEMTEEQWYPIRYVEIAPLKMIPYSGFEIVDHRRIGGIDLVPERMLEKLNDDPSQVE